MQRLQDLIIGGARTLTDTADVLPPLSERVASRYGLRTEPGADVHVRVQCVWQHRTPSEIRAAAEAAGEGAGVGGVGGGGGAAGVRVGNSVADILASLRTRSLAGTLRRGGTAALGGGEDAGGARYASLRRRDGRSPSPIRDVLRGSGRRSPGSEGEGGAGGAGEVGDVEERARLRLARREARRARLRERRAAAGANE